MKLGKEFFDGERFEIGKSFRIGIRNDLKEKMRFYIIGNKFVSGKK